MELKILVMLHVLGATVWAGGHLVLALGILPEALRRRDASIVLAFERRYERIGLPALVVQILTGLRLAMLYVDPSRWLSFAEHTETTVGLKLMLLVATLLLAVHARLRVIPQLTNERLPVLAWHIVAVTVIAVAMVLIGVNFHLALW